MTDAEYEHWQKNDLMRLLYDWACTPGHRTIEGQECLEGEGLLRHLGRDAYGLTMFGEAELFHAKARFG